MVQQKDLFISAFGKFEIHVVEQLPDSGKPNPTLPVLFCLHGLTRTWLDFEAFGTVAASAGFRVLSADYPGRGLSQWAANEEDAKTTYCQKNYCPTFADVAAQLGINKENKCIIVGQSLGGISAWNLAATNTNLMHESVSKIVLIDVGPELHIPGLMRIGKYTNAVNDVATFKELRELFVARFQTFSPLTDAQIDKFLVSHARRLPNGRWALQCDPQAPALSKFDVFNITSDDQKEVWGTFDHVECPIVVIRGGDSDLLVPEGIEKMKQHCKKGPEQLTAIEVPGVGHVPLFQSKEEIDVLMKVVMN